MDTKVSEIEINGVKYVPKDSTSPQAFDEKGIKDRKTLTTAK